MIPKSLKEIPVMSKVETPVDIAKESLIPWAQSVDSQLWNDRVEYLINRLAEAEKKNNEPKISEG